MSASQHSVCKNRPDEVKSGYTTWPKVGACWTKWAVPALHTASHLASFPHSNITKPSASGNAPKVPFLRSLRGVDNF